MERKDIIACAEMFARLQAKLQKDNAADLQQAQMFPLKMALLYQEEAMKRHLLDEETNAYIAERYGKMDSDVCEKYFSTALSLPDQGVWQLAYSRAKQELHK